MIRSTIPISIPTFLIKKNKENWRRENLDQKSITILAGEERKKKEKDAMNDGPIQATMTREMRETI